MLGGADFQRLMKLNGNRRLNSPLRNIFGRFAPRRSSNCLILGIGQSILLVIEFRRLKSIQNLQDPSGFGTRFTWLYSLACDTFSTHNCYKSVICLTKSS